MLQERHRQSSSFITHPIGLADPEKSTEEIAVMKKSGYILASLAPVTLVVVECHDGASTLTLNRQHISCKDDEHLFDAAKRQSVTADIVTLRWGPVSKDGLINLIAGLIACGLKVRQQVLLALWEKRESASSDLVEQAQRAITTPDRMRFFLQSLLTLNYETPHHTINLLQ